MNPQDNPLKPDRLEYIVFHHPDKVKNLIEDFGHKPPSDLLALVEAVRFLIREYKQEAVVALLKLHPDRKALQAIDSEDEDQFCSACSENSYNAETHYCGSCGHSNYTGNRLEFLEQLRNMGEKKLQEYYENLVKKSNLHPEDKKLAEEVQLVWNHLRNKKETHEEPIEESAPMVAMEQSLFLGVFAMVFAVGVIVGSGIKTP